MKLADLILEKKSAGKENAKEAGKKKPASKRSPALKAAIKEMFSAAKGEKDSEFADAFTNALRIYDAEKD